MVDDSRAIICNKEKLFTQCFPQLEVIDYEENYAPIAHLETIHIFLACVAHKSIKVYQKDVKSTFLNCELKEQLYL